MNKLAKNVMQAIGKVPTVRINNISPICKSHNLYLKLESCNPGGSIKEKNAVYLIEQAEKKGLLASGGTIIESSSGNFGIGLAMIGAAKGYRVWIVVDAKTPPPTRRMIEAYGAILIDVPLTEADANGSMQVARMKKAADLAQATPGAWYPCQHKNPENPTAHSIYTAREIIDDFGGTPPSAVVVGISTSGQLTGIGSYLKRFYPQITIIGVDVAGSSVLGTPSHPYKMTGLGLSFVPPQFDGNLLDLAYSVPDALAFSVCRTLAQKEGLLLGGSTGAVVAAGLSYAINLKQNQSILMVNPDRGDRYLETIFNNQWIENQRINLSSGDSLQKLIENLEPIPEFYFKQKNKKA
ncbi:PLP-dependent cysteine synthase family protein [Fluviispira multicolorata]|uniref:Pyridoxal-phosphate dependent enzyme n=1 Tax=Fluviispira multicolorata TaxID=2654512 RepID=A0A833JCZ0_9BACT|nr:cysteine synthase family protein [Fluviispira multicolorata]KAB8031006.1 pyridoxal-phosphate dependent enzyme [Fluviispira multicolorata]